MKKINRLKNFIEHLVNDVNLSIISSFLDWFMDKLELHFLKPAPDLVFEKWDIYFVDLWKNTGNELNKIRPCLVYSKKRYNFWWTILVLPLKSFKWSYKKDFSVFVSASVFNSLKKHSIADISSLRQISKKRVLNYIWRLEKEILCDIDEKLISILWLKKEQINAPLFDSPSLSAIVQGFSTLIMITL